MTPPPFLSVEGRVAYLYERDYFAPGTLRDEHRARLGEINFHHFLGYARNYRALVGRRHVRVSEKHPDDVFRVIDMDACVSGLVHEGLRGAEWHLRSAVVEHYCAKFDPCGSYLLPGQYSPPDARKQQQMVANILRSIYRHDEPYVSERLADAARAAGTTTPRRYEAKHHDLCLALAADLPLWAVVDSFSIGLLGQFVMSCDEDDGFPVWKAVARSLDLKARVFPTQIRSLAYVRNTVAHHARLWMRPTSDSAKRPMLFDDRLKESHPKSMHWAFMNVATFLPADQRQAFAARIDKLLAEDDLYRYGISHV